MNEVRKKSEETENCLISSWKIEGTLGMMHKKREGNSGEKGIAPGKEGAGRKKRKRNGLLHHYILMYK